METSILFARSAAFLGVEFRDGFGRAERPKAQLSHVVNNRLEILVPFHPSPYSLVHLGLRPTLAHSTSACAILTRAMVTREVSTISCMVNTLASPP